MDTDLDNSSLGSAVTYTLAAPLDWSAISEFDQLTIDERNEKTLRVLMSLGELPAEHNEDLAALDFKLNIIMELMAELLNHQLKLPPRRKIKMGANQMVWKLGGEQGPALNSDIEVSIFPHSAYPKALLLRGEVVSLENNCCTVTFATQGEQTQELLEKFIFMHHRHAIALARQAKSV